MTLIQGLVISRIWYCLAVYGVCNRTQMKRVQKLLNFAARVLSGRREFDHVSDVLQRLGWLTADRMYLYRGLTLLKRMITTSEQLSRSPVTWSRAVMFTNVPLGTLTILSRRRSEMSRAGAVFGTRWSPSTTPCPPAIRCLTTNSFKKELEEHLLMNQRGGVG